MGKYLRHLAVHPEPAVLAVLKGNTNHLCWMYEHYLTPYPTGGVGKVNVHLTGDVESISDPTECLGIVDIREYFDIEHYPSLSAQQQQCYYLDRIRSALLSCCRRFEWNASGVEDARERMLADELQFVFGWKKPLSSHDRSTKVQGFVEVSERTHISLKFVDRSDCEILRSLLNIATTGGSFDLGHIFGRISWDDNRTVRVTKDNGRDYWLCTTSGAVEFHYPPADGGNAAGEFALGRMYFEGIGILIDRGKGLQLIHSSASKGHKHAQSYLRRLTEIHDA